MTVDPLEVERLLDEREAQGLPRTIEDPVVLARIAAILQSAQPAKGNR